MQINAIIDAARAHVREVGPVSVAERLAEYLVLDVREPQEVLYGYLPGAINIPRGTVEFRVTDDARFADPTRAILVYSDGGRRSVLAAQTLSQLGFCDVQSLAGGIQGWAAENLPIE